MRTHSRRAVGSERSSSGATPAAGRRRSAWCRTASGTCDSSSGKPAAMAPLLTSRLRTRLLILSLIGVLPALGVIVYTQSIERSQARERALDDNRRLTRLPARPPPSLHEGAHRPP